MVSISKTNIRPQYDLLQSRFNYDHLRNIWLCTDCVVTIPVMYNPFNVLSYDKHNPNKTEFNDDIESISKNLNSCKVYNK